MDGRFCNYNWFSLWDKDVNRILGQMRILLKGYYGFGNLGDDILMLTTHHLMKKKYPEAQFFVFSNFDSDLKGFSQQPGYNNYIIKLLGEQLTIINWTYQGEFDLVIDGGGGVYFGVDKGSRIGVGVNKVLIKIGVKYVYRLDQFLRKLSGRKRHLTYKSRVGFGIGVGPYSSSSILFYRHLVEIGSTSVLFVRDKTSLGFLNLIKFRGVKELCADVAFLWANWQHQFDQHRKKKSDINKIGIILLDWQDGDDSRFMEFQEFANKQIENGKSVTFFSFDENADKRYFETFSNRYDYKVWRPNKMELKEFLEPLSQQDILFSARAHGVIIGAIYGVPSICIGVSPKLIEVSKMLPLGTSVVGDYSTATILEEELGIASRTLEARLDGLKQNVLANINLGLKSWEHFSNEL